MDETVFTYLLRHIAEQKEMVSEALAAGHAPDYNAYCKMTGAYAALVDLEATVKELEQRQLDA